MKPKDENDSGSWISRRTALAAGAAAAAVPVLSPIGAAAQSTSKPLAQTQGGKTMTSITTKDGTKIASKDWRKGQPILFSHGWPLASDAWAAQRLVFGQNGARVMAHDR